MRIHWAAKIFNRAKVSSDGPFKINLGALCAGTALELEACALPKPNVFVISDVGRSIAVLEIGVVETVLAGKEGGLDVLRSRCCK